MQKKTTADEFAERCDTAEDIAATLDKFGTYTHVRASSDRVYYRRFGKLIALTINSVVDGEGV